MNSALILVGLAILAAQTGVCWALARSLRPPPPATATPAPGPAEPAPTPPDRPADRPTDFLTPLVALLEQHAIRLASLETTVAGLPGLWHEEADRANRAAEREAKAGRRSRARRAAEAGDGDVDAGGDAGAGDQGELLAVPGNVASAPDQETVMAAARRALYLHAMSGTKA